MPLSTCRMRFTSGFVLLLLVMAVIGTVNLRNLQREEARFLHFGRRELRQKPPPSGTEPVFTLPRNVEYDGVFQKQRLMFTALALTPPHR